MRFLLQLLILVMAIGSQAFGLKFDLERAKKDGVFDIKYDEYDKRYIISPREKEMNKTIENNMQERYACGVLRLAVELDGNIEHGNLVYILRIKKDQVLGHWAKEILFNNTEDVYRVGKGMFGQYLKLSGSWVVDRDVVSGLQIPRLIKLFKKGVDIRVTVVESDLQTHYTIPKLFLKYVSMFDNYITE